MLDWISANTEFVFRLGLLGFLFGVILMLVDRDFEKRFQNGFIRKAFAMRRREELNIRTEPFGTIFSVLGAGIALLALGLAGS